MNGILTLLQSAVSNRFFRRMLTALGLAAFVISGPSLRAASPDFQTTVPRGGQRGAEVEVTFTGNRLNDAEDVLFHFPGISLKPDSLKVESPQKVTGILAIAPDCRLGEHHLRLRCRSGISYARNFWVSQFPTVDEAEPNDDFDAPQIIPMNSTVEGVAKPEEVDFYRVTAKKGQRISVEVEALRINTRANQVAIDPYVAILDKNRFALAVSDDSSLLKQDSVVSVLAPEDGDYTIEIRDSAYQGNGRYRAHIGDFPRPTGIYPAGGKAGTEVEFTLLGDPKGAYKHQAKLPGETQENFEVFGPDGGLLPPSGNRVRVSPFDNVLEQEPNNNIQEAAAAEAKALPLAFNGVLQQENDIDFFKFSAKKGQKFRFRSHANRIGSPVDTVLSIYDAKGKSLGSNDDADGLTDSRIDFTAPEDGEYFVAIRDMLHRGGDDFFYRIEAEPFDPAVLVTMPEMQRNDTQYWKQFNVPRGNAYAMIVNVSRQNFAGDLVFDLPGLPAGVTWEAGTIPKSLSQFPIVLKAAPDAPIGGAMCELLVRNADPATPVVGRFQQQLDFVRGNPNGALYYASEIDRVPVAVTEEAPFRISVDSPKAPLVRDGVLNLKVRAHRQEGFEKKIVVRVLWRPPGISCPATMTFDEKATELDYELNANANAELNTWKIAMLAESDTDTGKVIVGSPFAELRVEEPFVGMKMTMATVKQGENVSLVCDLEQLRDFSGQAEVQLLGLPAKATAPALKIDKDATQISFPVTAADDTPVGQHKNLFCSLVIRENGEPITHRVGMGGLLRVDPKPKEPTQPAPEQKTDVAKSEPAQLAEKPLSRLEQLRLEAKKQAESSAQ